MRALRGIQPLYHIVFIYKSYNSMGVPNFWASPIFHNFPGKPGRIAINPGSLRSAPGAYILTLRGMTRQIPDTTGLDMHKIMGSIVSPDPDRS